MAICLVSHGRFEEPVRGDFYEVNQQKQQRATGAAAAVLHRSIVNGMSRCTVTISEC